MLRPERMSKVSVTGSKGIMPTVIEAIHELNLVHLSDYDGSWEGFDNGNPIEGGEQASEKLVTVRALESKLDLTRTEDQLPTLGADWESRLERIRTTVNNLDDERERIRETLRSIDERIDRVEPFATLEIDLDLLSGYSFVDVFVGRGNRDDISSQLEASAAIGAFELFEADDVVAIVAAPPSYSTDVFEAFEHSDTDVPIDGIIEDALVGIEYDAYDVPESNASPSEYLAELESEKTSLESELADIDEKLEDIKAEHGNFLLAIEVELSIEAQRADAPLQFATTERAFVAEGWIPATQYDELVASLRTAVGDSVDVEELVRKDYDDHEVHDEHESGDQGGSGPESERDGESTNAGQQKPAVATDGGHADSEDVVTMDDDPPVILDNVTPAKPFELMVKMVNQPKYSELDPTLLVFLTFPFAFGFMIGDIGYGILYMGIGWMCWKLFDSDAGKAIGTIAIWAGVFTILFGYLYDDIFGIHMSDIGLAWLPLAGALDKGLQFEQWALLWIVASILFGILHLNVGLVMGFVNELRHGLKAAIYERFSWILAMNGLFIWIFSFHAIEHKPEFLVGTADQSVLYQFLGFAGLPEIVGLIGLAAFLVGSVMVGVGEGIAGVFEIPAWAFGHVLSYLRMVAVLLAKGGMAFVVNLLVFGGYTDPATGYTAFHLPGYDVSGYEQDFVGLVHMGDTILMTALMLVLAVVIFVLGHVLVLLLGITAAGIQMLRLEYVEFFQKFYEGGGEEYDPFGHEEATSAS